MAGFVRRMAHGNVKWFRNILTLLERINIYKLYLPVDTKLKFLDFEIYTDKEKGSLEVNYISKKQTY